MRELPHDQGSRERKAMHRIQAEHKTSRFYCKVYTLAVHATRDTVACSSRLHVPETCISIPSILTCNLVATSQYSRLLFYYAQDASKLHRITNM